LPAAKPKKTEKVITDKLTYFSNDLINIGILFIFWLLFFRELFTGSAWLWDDFPYVYYPGKVLAAVSLSNGIFPFWDPYQFGGMPFFADPQIAVLYPFNYILKYFVSADTLSPLVVQNSLLIHYFICSIFTYLLGKQLGFNKFASLLLAMIYAYSSFMIIHMVHFNIVETAVWLPIIFYFIIKFINTFRYYDIIIAGILASLSIFAGYPQVYFYNYVFFSLFFAYNIYIAVREKNYTIIKHYIAGIIIFAGISAAISSVQILPTNVFSDNSERTDATYEFAKQGSVNPLDLFTLITPKIYGIYTWNQKLSDLKYWSVFSAGGHQEGPWMFTVSTIYITLLPLFFIFPAIKYSLLVKNKKLPVIYFSLFSLIILLFSFGGNFFLHKLFYDYVPLFGRFRNAGHSIYLLEMLLGIISCYFIYKIFEDDSIIKKILTQKYIFICAGFVILLFILSSSGTLNSFWKAANTPQITSWIQSQFNMFALFAIAYLVLIFLYLKSIIKKNNFAIMMLVLLAADIYSFGYGINNGSVNPNELYSQNSAMINKIKDESKAEAFRTQMRNGPNMLFQRYQGAVSGIELLEGINVLILKKKFPFNKIEENSTQFNDLMNIKYSIAKDGKSLNKSDIYLPRGKMFYSINVLASDDDIKNYMQSKEYDYRKTLVLEKSPANMNLPKNDTAVNSSVKITERNINMTKYEVETSENGFFWMSEVYYPDFTATVDGNAVEIFRANYSQRAVYLEKGKHEVIVRYNSKEFNNGVKISSAGIILALAGIGFSFYRHKKSINNV